MVELHPLNVHAAGRTLYTYFGNTRITSESVAGSGDTWQLANFPTVTTDIRLNGFRGADEFFISNFDIEPISGTVTLNATDASGITSLEATYDHYAANPAQIVLDTNSFNPVINEPTSQTTIDNREVYSLTNVYPSKLDIGILFNFDNLAIKNAISTAISKAQQFLVIDLVARRAYEGFITSSQFLTTQKGEDVVIPIRIHVQQFGDYDVATDTIDWSANKN